MTRVKICGLTNLEDALVAIAAGADLLGFVFYAKSPRGVTAAQAASIIQEIRRRPYGQGAVQIVGLFVDAPLHEMQETILACQLDLVQLHGGEPPHWLEQLAPRAFKALRPTSLDEAAAEAEWYADLGPPAGPQLLLDAFHPQLYGGSGRLGDWALAAGLAPRYRILLAGGLTPDNVRQAVRQVRPWGVDVSSGVEAAPGHKDPEKVRRFVAEAKQAFDRGAQ
ncbi:MAG: phosphoribosylanthranilate isomerase [Anaerolineae bacterium]